MNSRPPQPKRGRTPRNAPPRRPAPRIDLAGDAMPAAQQASVERLRRIERRKARTRAAWLSVFVLLIMFVTVVMIITVMQRTKPKPRFQFIQSGEITHTVPSTGLILRDEEVFNAASAGVLKPLATEGSRAGRGQKVALVIPEKRENDLRQLQKIEKDIVDLQNQLINSGKGAGARAIFDESRAQLSTLVNLVRSDAGRGDLSSLHAYKTSMDVVIEQRNTRLLSIDFKDVRLEQLRSAKASLETQLGLAAGTITCQKPGIISFRLDGMESALGSAQASTLTLEAFRGYRDAASGRLPVQTSVQPGKPVLRVTSSLSQVLAFEAEGSLATRFEIGKTYDIQLPKDGLTIEACTVLRSEQHDGSTFLVFKTDRMVEWLSDRRTVEAVLTYSRTKGMKVPLSAILSFDEAGSSGEVMLVVGGYTRRARVRVSDHDREYALIESVDGEAYKPEVSSVLVLNPTAIEEGAFIGG